MSQIEVPDWVVEAACKNAWPQFRSGMETEIWEFADASRRDRLREITHAALAAALGAWVVPVGRKQPHKEYLMQTRAHDDYAAGLFGDAGINIAAKFTEQVYVLRQEKPE